MNRIDRISAILIQLQSKKIVRARDIAERFDISLRTVYRDIRALEEAGVPIGAEAGIGYFIMEGYSLPPIGFTRDEAGAIIMAGKLAEKHTDKSIQHNFKNALYKIKSALKVSEKDYLESLESSIEVIQPPKRNQDQFPDHFLTDIQAALAHRHVLNFDYYSNHSDTFTNRDVEPLSLCFYSQHWHLIGYCKLRQALRDFRSDRIMKLRTRDETFERQKHNSYQDYLASIILGSDLLEATVRFTTKTARLIGEQKYYFGYITEHKMQEGVEMKFMTSNLDSFSRWIMQYGDQVVVKHPHELLTLVKKNAELLYLHHGGE